MILFYISFFGYVQLTAAVKLAQNANAHIFSKVDRK